MRIISLIPSATDIVYALGMGDNLVGRSHECDYPTDVLKLPICTETYVEKSCPSGMIDRQVKTLMEQGLAVYDVLFDELQRLKPDIILTQDQCELCAVSLKDVEKAVCNIVESRPKVFSLRPMQLSDLYEDIERAAEAIGIPKQGKILNQQLQERMQHIRHLVSNDEKHPRVALIDWVDPVMGGGIWMPELVEIAGGKNLLGHVGEHCHATSWAEIAVQRPDVIVIAACGFDINRTLEEMALLQDEPDFLSMPAVQRGEVYVADGNHFFNRPGPRLVESAEILAEILHPEHAMFGHHPEHWVRYNVALALMTIRAEGDLV